MRRITSLLIILFSSTGFAKTPEVCSQGNYVGPMHPHIRGEKGDTCPICGMKLSPDPACFAEEESQGSNEKGLIKIDNKFQQQFGIKVAEAIEREFGFKIRAFGEVTISSRNTYNINMRSEGWVVELATDAVGDDVEKGDLLFTLYSPEILRAQTDYLIGGSVDKAEERLKLQGMDDKAILEFKKKGSLLRNTPFYSPINGTVSVLNIRKGSYIKSGELALTLQKFDDVWVEAYVPIKDIAFLRKGQTAEVIVPGTGKSYASKIDYIHHIADPMTRTGKVRLVLDHANREPKPGVFVDVIFQGEGQKRLSVPEESVFYSSNGTYLVEKIDARTFRPIKVSTGITANGYTEITSGLNVGQSIVVSGQFLIDAESNLRNGFSAMSSSLD